MTNYLKTDLDKFPGGDSRVVAWRKRKHPHAQEPLFIDDNVRTEDWMLGIFTEPLVPLSSLEAVERERDAALDELTAAWAKHGGMEIAKGQWQARAESAEANLAIALKRIATLEAKYEPTSRTFEFKGRIYMATPYPSGDLFEPPYIKIQSVRRTDET